MEAMTQSPVSVDGKKDIEKAKKDELQSFNPVTGEYLGSVDTITPGQVQGIVDEVAEAQLNWGILPLEERAKYLRSVAQALLENSDELATLLTREQGKPIAESYTAEIMPTIDLLHWCADNGPKILADEKIKYTQIFLKQKKSIFSYEPYGVVGVIGPWNYPWSIPFGEVAIALMAGNGVVLKPASLTCLIGQKVQEIFELGGLPTGLLRAVHGGGKVGQAMIESSINKIFFTGSVEVGRKVGEDCARLMKGSVLELGGKDPQIVLSDAHIPHAISGCVWAGFVNAGQSCAGIERVYVMRDVADQFISGVVEEAKNLKIGNPMEDDTEISAMTSESQYEIVVDLVDDAVKNGATMHCGGPFATGMPGKFYAPTVLTDVNHDMRIMNEEIFGAVVPIMIVDSEEEAIRLANDSDFGLGASIWTSDREHGTRLARRINTGTVWINEHLYSHGACQCTWGGVKDSGLGRSHSKFGFYECVNIKHIAWEPSFTRSMWWYPYDTALKESTRGSLKLLFSQDGGKLKALAESAIPTLKVTRRMLRDSLWRRKNRR